jgi:glycosyltransferase involved in cell wall biosynthesis
VSTETSTRVLLDLSYGALGYSGIPQETRLLLKVMGQCGGVDATGLVFGVSNAAISQRPARTGSRDRRLEHQADVLFRISGGDTPPPDPTGGLWNRVANLWRSARRSGRALFGRRARLGELDGEFFWDVLWRKWLSQTLADGDRDLARRPVLLSDVSTAMLNTRAYFGLPAPRLDTRAFDFALFHEARAVRVSPNTCKVVRHYDLIPALRPDTVSSTRQIRAHVRAVRRCERDSIFTCISESAREDLVRLFPHLAERAVTIPCTLADGYYPEHLPQLLPGVVAARQSSTAAQHPPGLVRRLEKAGRLPPYLLIVSTIEPRKNHVALVRAFERVLARRDTDLRLVVVGTPGWRFHEALQVMGPLIRRGRLFHLDKVPQAELRVLYSHAEAVVFPSLYEGFGYSPLEGMCCGTAAIASGIAAHKWAFGDAAEYCDPYRVDSIAEAVERVCLDASHRGELIARGRKRVTRYRVRGTAAQWGALFAELRRQGITHNVGDARLADFNEELRRIERQQEELAEVDTPPGPNVLPFAA